MTKLSATGTADPIEPVRIVDCIGLKCPLPVLKARKALRAVRPGDVVRVDSTDPVAILDVPAMAREDGHEVVETVREGDIARFFIQRGAA